ncbi:MAG TPA: hypothetical protein VMT53_13725 [Terriglobales bacterium]|nr:hypothetical protein [Terriglobales bacterium]
MRVVLRLATLLFIVVLWWTACGKGSPSGIPKQEPGEARDQGSLPFNQPKKAGGISPTSSLVPAAVQVPAGTPVIVRLKSSISSATAHVGDSFEAVLDQAIVVQGKPIFSAGTPVLGTVVALKRTARVRAPAYLRVKITSITWRGKIVPIESSSIFAKAGLPRIKQQRNGSEVGEASPDLSAVSPTQRQVRFPAGQRLSFRLTNPTAVPQ